jgi:hypothetical protein
MGAGGKKYTFREESPSEEDLWVTEQSGRTKDSQEKETAFEAEIQILHCTSHGPLE